MTFPKIGVRRPATAFTVGHSATSGDRVFVDYRLPGGQTLRVMDRDIFSEAVKRGSRVLQEISEKYRGIDGDGHEAAPACGK